MISLRFQPEDEKLIKDYAAFNNTSVSEFMRQAALERIEDEYDLKTFREAMAEFQKDPVTYSHEDAWKMIEEE